MTRRMCIPLPTSETMAPMGVISTHKSFWGADIIEAAFDLEGDISLAAPQSTTPQAALEAFAEALSRWYESLPVPNPIPDNLRPNLRIMFKVLISRKVDPLATFSAWDSLQKSAAINYSTLFAWLAGGPELSVGPGQPLGIPINDALAVLGALFLATGGAGEHNFLPLVGKTLLEWRQVFEANGIRWPLSYPFPTT